MKKKKIIHPFELEALIDIVYDYDVKKYFTSEEIEKAAGWVKYRVYEEGDEEMLKHVLTKYNIQVNGTY